MINHYMVVMIFTDKLQIQKGQIYVSEWCFELIAFEALIKNGRYFVFFCFTNIISLDTHIHIVYMVHFVAVESQCLRSYRCYSYHLFNFNEYSYLIQNSNLGQKREIVVIYA